MFRLLDSELKTVCFSFSFFLKISVIAALISQTLWLTNVQATQLDTDHPLISRYKDAKYFSHHAFDYDYADFLVTPFNGKGEKSVLSIKGTSSFINYNFPDNASHFQVVESFKSLWKKAPFELVFECQKTPSTNSCGNKIRELTFQYKIKSGFQGHCTTEDEFYIATSTVARKEHDKTYVFVCVTGDKVNQTIVEQKALDNDNIELSSDYVTSDTSFSALKPQTNVDIEGSADHPLLSRIPNSVIAQYTTQDFVQAAMPIRAYTKSQDELSNEDIVKTSGKVTFIEYEAQQGLSQFQIYQNYLVGLTNESSRILFSCLREECKSSLPYFSGIGTVVPALNKGDNCNGNLGVITAKTQIESKQNAYIYICVSDNSTPTITQIIIEEKELTANLISLSVDEIATEISDKGKVAIYGIHFESDSDQLMKTSAPTLKKLADLLNQQPTLNLYVVGHTDSQGDEAYNQILSKKRADAVIKELVQSYGIAHTRLQARGVGELVPVSTNRASEGRQLNRRVELVEI